MQKKLFIVVNQDWFFLSHRKDVALASKEAGWDVTIVTSDTGKLQHIEALGLKTINLLMSRSGMNIVQELMTLNWLRKLYKRERPDVVHHVGMNFTRFNPATDITLRYFDDLVLNPEIKILTRSVSFGYEEELDMIRNNKAMFPFLYHLNTPVRNNYQYTFFLVWFYHRYPHTIRYLRQLYKGDNLRFYRDFYKEWAAKHILPADYPEQ